MAQIMNALGSAQLRDFILYQILEQASLASGASFGFTSFLVVGTNYREDLPEAFDERARKLQSNVAGNLADLLEQVIQALAMIEAAPQNTPLKDQTVEQVYIEVLQLAYQYMKGNYKETKLLGKIIYRLRLIERKSKTVEKPSE